MNIFFKISILTLLSGKVFSQDSLKLLAPSPEYNKSRFAAVLGTQIASYGGSLALLSNAWYKEYDQTSFHTFNDSKEWLQMDKAGHFATAWYMGRISSDMYRWSGVSRGKAALYGTAGSFLYMTGIEVLDGFSNGWGFSWSDLGANVLGSGLMFSQQWLKDFKEHYGCTCDRSYHHRRTNGFIGMSLKYSYHPTGFPKFRPSLLGKTISEQLLKDYNGQAYWLSFNVFSFLYAENKFPKWLNVAVGYGAEGMISGTPGYTYTYPNGNTVEFQRYRQYYLSLDIDLTKIKTKSHFLKTIFEAISFIKIPAPAVEFNKNGIKLHPIYY